MGRLDRQKEGKCRIRQQRAGGICTRDARGPGRECEGASEMMGCEET